MLYIKELIDELPTAMNNYRFCCHLIMILEHR